MTKLLAQNRLSSTSSSVTAAGKTKPPKWLPAIQQALTDIFTRGSVKVINIFEGEVAGTLCMFKCASSNALEGPGSIRIGDDGHSDASITGFVNFAKLCKQKHLTAEITPLSGLSGFTVLVGDEGSMYD